MAPERQPPPEFGDSSELSDPEKAESGTSRQSSPPIDPFRQTTTLTRRVVDDQRTSGFFESNDAGRYHATDLPAESVLPPGVSSFPPDTPASLTSSSLTSPAARRRDTPVTETPPSKRIPAGDLPPPSAPRRRPTFSEVGIPQLSIPPAIEEKAREWLRTQELKLSREVSAREARAWQRVLLLALLADRSPRELPRELAQRASWLFREGWEKNSSEIDDCLVLLRLPNDPRVRAELLQRATSRTRAL